VIIGFVALAIDVGRVRNVQRNIQYAADAGSAAGALLVGDAAFSDKDVILRAQIFAIANGLSAAEISAGGGIEVGNWDSANRRFSPGAAVRNAVRVRALRTVGSSFAQVIGRDVLTPRTVSVAVNAPSQPACVKPFGFDKGLIDSLKLEENFVIGSASPGNWWKVNLAGINMSSGTNFSDAMLGKVCPSPVAKGDLTSSATGFSNSIPMVFEDVINAKLQRMIVPVVTVPKNGKSSVEILEFAEVELRNPSYAGKNGANWQAEFKLIRYPVDIANGAGYTPVSRAFVQ
jgi:hypothetical protein